MWTAYQMLRQTRVVTVGVGAAVTNPISYAEVKAYADLHLWQDEDAADLAYFVRVLDNRYLGLEADKAEAAIKAGKKSGTPPRRH